VKQADDDSTSYVSAFVPRRLKQEFAELAADHDRSFSAELRQAMAAWLERYAEQPGANSVEAA
jgi:hypothetical protein